MAKNRKSLRKDGKPRATAEQITAARKVAAAARWAGRSRTAWRSIRVHADTYAVLEEVRIGCGITWDNLLARLAAKFRR